MRNLKNLTFAVALTVLTTNVFAGGIDVSNGMPNGVVVSGVATPVLLTDAANRGYVDAAAMAVSAQAATARDSAQAAQFTANFAVANGLQEQIIVDHNRQILSAGIAASMSTQQSLPPVSPGENAVGVGIGTFDGQSAVGVAFAHGLAGTGYSNAMISAGVSISNGLPAARAGFSFKF